MNDREVTATPVPTETRVGCRLSVPASLTVGGTVALLLGLVLLLTVYDLHRVRTATMLPTVPVSAVGVYASVDDPDQIDVGDVVRFRSDWPEAEGFDELTFRVVATGGQTIEGDADGRLSVDGEPLFEPYVDASTPTPQQPFEVTVPEGRLFVAGDARGTSNDSRTHLDDGQSGTIAASSVSARLVGVTWPVWQWSTVDDSHGTPYAFVAASLLVAGGVLVLLCLGARSLSRRVEARRERRGARSA